MVLILICLTIGILIPDIELVLGFVGSTMGASVCVIFPGAVFLKLSNKETTERLAARAVLVLGVVMLILGSYVNLEEASRSSAAADYPNKAFVQPAAGINDPVDADMKKAVDVEVKEKIEKNAKDVIMNISNDNIKKLVKDPVGDSARMEPAVPEEPKIDKVEDAAVKEEVIEKAKKDSQEKVETEKDKVKVKESKELKGSEDKEDSQLAPEIPVDRDKKDLGSDEVKAKEDQVNAEKLLKELERQKNESAKILEKQKEILKELEQHKKDEMKVEPNDPQQQNIQAGQQQQQQNIPQQQFQPELLATLRCL